MKLKHKIPLAFLVVTFLLAATGLFGIFRLNQSLTIYQTSVQNAAQNERAVNDLLYQFKVQVQEWKNTLLRGKDPIKLQTSWGRFQQQQTVVNGLARALQQALPAGDSQNLVNQFTSAHTAMGEAYRTGFNAFTSAHFDASVGDAAVIGVDREPSQRLVDAAKKIAAENAMLVQQTSAGADQALVISMVLMACVVALSVVGGVLFSNTIVRPIMQAAHVAQTVASGDLTSTIEATSDDEIGLLLTSLKDMNDRLVELVSTVRTGSESVANASAEIAAGNHDLSARTESQASALEQTAANMGELASTVNHSAANARQASQLATSASSVAEQGGRVVGQVVETMKGINESSNRISDIIGVIDGIAFQTNILALNAAVEAARAGDQGRGFAVVASEVRALAGRSAAAAKEIKQLITESVQRVEDGTMQVGQAGATMSDVVTGIRRVTVIVGEISAASDVQDTSVGQIGRAVTQIDQTTQQNAALVEQMAAAASSLKNLAGDLVEAISVFKISAQTQTQTRTQARPRGTGALTRFP